MIIKKFVAPALPIPKKDYDQTQQTDLIRALRLYFNLLDDYFILNKFLILNDL